MLFGHGPIFRDLNAVLDPQAVSVVLASGIPRVLVPYTAAALLVAQQPGLPPAATTTAQALYCDVVRVRVEDLFP